MWVRTQWNQLIQAFNFRIEYGVREFNIYTDDVNEDSNEHSTLLAKYKYQFEAEIEIDRIESIINNSNSNVFRFLKPLKETDLYEIAKNNGIKEEISVPPDDKNIKKYSIRRKIVELKSYEGECIVEIKGKQFRVIGWPIRQVHKSWYNGGIHFEELQGEGETSYYISIGGEVEREPL